MKTYTEQELEKILRDFADKVDELYRPYTKDNLQAWNFLNEIYLKEIKNGKEN